MLYHPIRSIRGLPGALQLLFVIIPGFDCCPLVWYFSSAKALQEIGGIQERAPGFLCDDHRTFHSELLLKSEVCAMHVSRLRVLCTEVFKTLRNM